MARDNSREVAELEGELKERQENFIRRERVYRMRLEELTGELDGLRAWPRPPRPARAARRDAPSSQARRRRSG